MRENFNIIAARRLRRQMTEAETRLWYLLRDRRFDGIKFRRQHALGAYVCDFICLEQKVIIELDGGQHAMQQTQDAARTAYLEKEGFTVLRFWNNEVFEQRDAVMKTILRCCSPHPNPLPQAGEGTSRPALAGTI